MKIRTVTFALAAALMASFVLIGCGDGGDGQITEADLKKGNEGLPPDDPKGPGSINPMARDEAPAGPKKGPG